MQTKETMITLKPLGTKSQILIQKISLPIYANLSKSLSHEAFLF